MHSHHCGRRPGRSIQTRSSAWAPASVKGWPRVLDTPRNLMFKKKQIKTCINKTRVTSPGQGSHFNFQVRHLLLRRWRLLRRWVLWRHDARRRNVAWRTLGRFGNSNCIAVDQRYWHGTSTVEWHKALGVGCISVDMSCGTNEKPSIWDHLGMIFTYFYNFLMILEMVYDIPKCDRTISP